MIFEGGGGRERETDGLCLPSLIAGMSFLHTFGSAGPGSGVQTSGPGSLLGRGSGAGLG